MKNRLMALLAKNAKRGDFRAADNTIYLYDMIVGDDDEAEFFGGISPNGFSAALSQMTGPVTIRINSPGGDVFGARAMAQAMREYSHPITCIVDGCAASAASIIAVSAGKTVMAPGALMMIHNAWTMTVGNAEDHLDTAGLLEKIDATIAQTYAAKSGKAADDFAAMMADETWLTPEEAVAAGLADEVAPETAKKPENKLTSWNLAAFTKAPVQDDTTVIVTVEVEVTEEEDAEDEATETETTEENTPAVTTVDAAEEIRIRARKHAALMLTKSA